MKDSNSNPAVEKSKKFAIRIKGCVNILFQGIENSQCQTNCYVVEPASVQMSKKPYADNQRLISELR